MKINKGSCTALVEPKVAAHCSFASLTGCWSSKCRNHLFTNWSKNVACLGWIYIRTCHAE